VKLHHWGYVCLLVMILVFALFSRPADVKKEAEPAMQAVSLPSPPDPPKQLPAPALDDVHSAVTRVFGDTVAVQGDFLSVDLNGDSSDDLIVAVRVRNGKLSQVTGDLANWSIQDVRDVELPPAHASTFKLQKNRAQPHVTYREPLLAVIHGYGSLGWRDPEARQAYLLVHASGKLVSVAVIRALEQNGAALTRLSANPTLALVEQQNDQPVAIYWTGAQYAAAELHAHATLVAQK